MIDLRQPFKRGLICLSNFILLAHGTFCHSWRGRGEVLLIRMARVEKGKQAGVQVLASGRDPQACKRQATFLYQQPPTQSVVFLCHARSLKSVEALFEQIPQCQRNVILVLTSSIPSTYVLGNAALGPVIRRLVASSSFMPTSRELTEAARIESPLSTTAR